MLLGLLVISVIGIAGQGDVWMRYVGSGMLFLLLMLILQQVSNMPDRNELQSMLTGEPEGEEIFSSEPGQDPLAREARDLVGKN